MIEWKSWIKDLIESYPIKNKNEVIEGIYTFYNTIKLLNPNYDKTVAVSSLSGGTKHSIEFLDKNKVSLGSINLVANDLKDVCLEFSVGGKKLGISCTDEGVAQSYVDTPVGEECHQIVNIEYLSDTITAWYNKIRTEYTELCGTLKDELLNTIDSQIKANTPNFTGIIVMWSGSESNIPTGWHLCDGTNGTPDLRGRFILGSDSTHSSGSTGGSSTYDLGKHYHYIGHHNNNNSGYFLCLGSNGKYSEIPTIPSKTVNGAKWNGNDGGNWNYTMSEVRNVFPVSNGENIVTSLNYANGTDNVSGGTSSETLPPYYALCFIMKL